MKVKGFLKDVTGASRVTKRRQAAYEAASSSPKAYDPIGDTARALHPGIISLTVESVKEAGLSAKTIRLSSDHLPYFMAGQFMTVILSIDGSRVSRPYSISSAPYETRGDHPYIEITVKKLKEDGFISEYLYDNAKAGDVYEGEVGLGEFHYDPIRDGKHILALAGGSGITPFLSMAREIRFGKLDVDLTILYGSVDSKDITLKEELEKCLCEKVRVVHVLSGDDPEWTGERGFLNADLIKKYTKEDTSYFVCGPEAMVKFLKGEFLKLDIPKRRIRYDVPGQPKDISLSEGYPAEKKKDVYELKVCQGIKETVVPARADESLAVALERAGLKIHTACRSGSCGVCRIKVLEGEYYVNPENDGRRRADKDFGYVHSCSTYPLSDMSIRINI